MGFNSGFKGLIWNEDEMCNIFMGEYRGIWKTYVRVIDIKTYKGH